MRSMLTRSRDTRLNQSLPDLDSLLFVNAPSSSNEPPQMATESVGLGGDTGYFWDRGFGAVRSA